MVGAMVAISIATHLLHLPHDGQHAASGIAMVGWMGAGAARLENLKPQGQ